MKVKATPAVAEARAVTERWVAVPVKFPGLTVNADEFDVIAPGFTTAIWAMPGVPRKLADTVAVSCVGLTNVVGRLVSLKTTIAPEMNPAPFTVSVIDALPAITIAGLKLVTLGSATMLMESDCVGETLAALS